MSTEINNSSAPNITMGETSPQRPSQDSALLRMPLEIIARIGRSLTPSESTRLSITCTDALLLYPSNAEAELKGAFREEVRQLLSDEESLTTVPLEAYKEVIFKHIDGLTLQNIEKTKESIQLCLLQFFMKLDDIEAEKLPIRGEIPLYHLKLAAKARKIRIQTAGIPKESPIKYQAINIFCRKLSDKFHFTEAFAIARRLPDDDLMKNVIFQCIAEGLARAQDFDGALFVADMMSPADPNIRGTYRDISLRLAQAQLFDRAITVTEKLPFADRARALPRGFAYNVYNDRIEALGDILSYAEKISDEAEKVRILALINEAAQEPMD